MSECKTESTPIQESKSPQSRLKMLNGSVLGSTCPYRKEIGSIMYLTVGARPDIAYDIGKLAQFCNSPWEEHWKAVKHV